MIALRVRDHQTSYFNFTNGTADVSVINQTYHVNNLVQWNPNTGGGLANQPIPGLEEISAIWGFYRVRGVKISAQFKNDTDIPMYCYIGYTDQVPIDLTLTTATTASKVTQGANGWLFSSALMNPGAVGTKRLKRYWNLDKANNGSIIAAANPDFGGSIAGTPPYPVAPALNRTACVGVYTGDLGPRDHTLTDHNRVYVTINLTFYTHFWYRDIEFA